jgi:hypothetical protein
VSTATRPAPRLASGKYAGRPTELQMLTDRVLDAAEVLALETLGEVGRPLDQVPDEEIGRVRAQCLAVVVARNAREIAGHVHDGAISAADLPAVTALVLGAVVANRRPELAGYFP